MRKTNISKALMKLAVIVIILGSAVLPGCAVLGLCVCDIDHPYMDNSGNCYSSQTECEQSSSEGCYVCD